MIVEGENKYFSAEDARRISNEISTGQMHQQLDWVYNKINEARFNGKRSITFSNKTLFESTIDFLKSKGFKIEYFFGDQRDPANDTTIYW